MNRTGWFIAFLLLLALLGQRELHNCDMNQPTYSDEIVIDTIIQTINVPVPADPIIIKDTVPQDVDTMAILQEYYSSYINTRAFGDSLLEITLIDTISQNKIIGSQLYYQLIKETIKLPPPPLRTKVFAGFSLSGSETNFGATASMLLINKKDNAYSLGTNLLQEQPNINVGMYWKIQLKK